MKRKDVLAEAERAVNGNREEDYGSPESNFETIAKLWSIYLDKDIDPQDVAAMMILLKISRVKSGSGKDDNWIDIAGYAACGGELAPENVPKMVQFKREGSIKRCFNCKYLFIENPKDTWRCRKCDADGDRTQWEPKEEKGERNG